MTTLAMLAATSLGTAGEKELIYLAISDHKSYFFVVVSFVQFWRMGLQYLMTIWLGICLEGSTVCFRRNTSTIAESKCYFFWLSIAKHFIADELSGLLPSGPLNTTLLHSFFE